ncbi:hypothetical protein LOTGIDRAFT_139793 [Lottia gigantea]|uniref:Methyltransferase type 11 domain-containing protein n=1 Tax=Lottia gigantea TaxID=225164 RepID=V4B5A4_LOTGI|nr:hypothetical protein LOTGIDRAFT_139793 [Lottia gigantea]ESP01177.1 hypothetical protein LOTGIDRAFT_139793 [Lottia gigantea]
MVQECEKHCKDLINGKKVEVVISSVEHMSFDNDYFDRVFHTNCYYFWPDLDRAVQEIVRVMKPGSQMVTALNLNALKEIKKGGFLQSGNPDPVRYMAALEMHGFENVEFKYENDRGFAFQVIFAKLGHKENNMDSAKL